LATNQNRFGEDAAAYWSFGTVGVNTKKRSQNEQREQISMASYALVAAVKNEGPYLLEWVAFHRLIGFDRILLYVQHGPDCAGPLLQALAANGEITLFDNPDGVKGLPPTARMRAYARALPELRSCDWIMALDVDEYLNITVGDGTVDDLVNDAGNASLISLSWRIFGSSGQVEFKDAPLLPRLLSAAPKGAPKVHRHKGIKTLFRPTAKIAQIMPHRPRLTDQMKTGTDPLDWVNGNGEDVGDTLRTGGWTLPVRTSSYDLGQINKYPIRSQDGFLLSNLWEDDWRRVPAFEPAEYADFDANDERDLSILRWEDAVAARMAELLKNADIAAGHTTTVKAYTAALARMSLKRPKAWDIILAPKKQAKEPVIEPKKAAKKAPPLKDDLDIAPRWLADLRRSGNRRGFYHSDDMFAAQFSDRGKEALVISFDNLSSVGDESLAREGWGYPFYRSEGWSHLGVMAFERHWFRNDALFDYMEDLAARGFFEGYKQVMFTGTSMGAYAATAFCRLAPGSTVVAFSPQSTLDTALVPWEKRFGSGRKQDWSGRYRDGPDCIAGAGAVYILYDPYFAPDRKHAERYQGDNVHHLKCWYADHKTALFMKRASILKPVVRCAVAGTLTKAAYYALYRERRKLPWYLNGLCDHLLGAGHTKLAMNLAHHLDATGRPSIGKSMATRVAAATS